MEVYPFSWLFYLTFIFLTTFAFLNMVIGIVVNVMENEHAEEEREKAIAEGQITIDDLSNQINELKALIEAQSKEKDRV
ncbi:MAG: ion transporter, partial [Oceanospirillaceae bacterium]|nr:ion transporter [Oceanospirillaceae bacterium]